jgi:hypothetical protein
MPTVSTGNWFPSGCLNPPSINLLSNAASGILTRWLNHLDPHLVTDPWSVDETKLLMRLHGQTGNHWKLIAESFPGRTDNQVKNQFFSTTRKMLRRAFKALGINCNTSLINKIKPKIMSEFLNRKFPKESPLSLIQGPNASPRFETYKDVLCQLFLYGKTFTERKEDLITSKKVLSDFITNLSLER